MATSIPLHCSICPKKPNFSDVSHLLTHVASKGHLSNYYKEKVRASSEAGARRSVEQYDRWYSDWNLEGLMSDRMTQKDKRRSRPRPAVRTAPTLKIDAPAPRPPRFRAAVGNLLDPRLSEQQAIKVESSSTPTSATQSGPVLRHRSFAPHMLYWPADSRASSRSYTNPDYETSSEYSDPSDRRRYHYTAEGSCAVEDDPVVAPTVDPMAVSESTRLKGVYWPGMDIFDSATPEMRRKRNQKKDTSVLEQLELNSQEVEATEMIFTPQGSFKRQRRISSSVYDEEEESPIKTESPKQTMMRSTLASMDVNAPRRFRPPLRPPIFPYLTRHSYNDDYERSAPEPSHNHHVMGRKRAFDVFQDEEVSFAHPAAFNYLTSGLHRPPSPTLGPSLPSYKSFGTPHHMENKENAHPTMYHPGFEHRHLQQPLAYRYHGYAFGHGHGHEQHTVPVFNPIFPNSAYQQDPEDDDQRTITAPPSPSTG